MRAQENSRKVASLLRIKCWGFDQLPVFKQ
jgi:hypothetical protein